MKIAFFFDHSLRLTPPRKSAIQKWKTRLKKLEKSRRLSEILTHIRPYPSQEALFHIILSSDAQLRELNQKYRQKNTSTDVLTFPYEDDHPELPWGDIYISIDTAEKHSKRNQISLESELALLSVHGILHAVGFDHERSAEDHIIMRRQESELLESIGLEDVSPMVGELRQTTTV